MKATELMIGDWVRLIKKTPIKEIVETDCITRIKALPGGVIYTEKEPCEEKHLTPVLLTSNILNKNFPDTRYNVFWRLDNRKEKWDWYEIHIEKDDMDVRIDIRYVHELQHALRLCGIEKEVGL